MSHSCQTNSPSLRGKVTLFLQERKDSQEEEEEEMNDDGKLALMEERVIYA